MIEGYFNRIGIRKEDGSYEVAMALRGESAYDIAKRYGFTGTEEEWNNLIQRQREEAVNAIQQKGTEVKNSIPADYTALNGKVTNLKEDLDGLAESITEISSIGISSVNEWDDGYVGFNNGVIVPYEGGLYKVSPHIRVVDFESIALPVCFDGYSGIAFYNIDGFYLSGIGKGEHKIGDIIKVVIPKNASTMRFTYKKDTISNIAVFNCTQAKENSLSGIGEAITATNYMNTLTDLDNAKKNAIYNILFPSNINQIANAPFYPFQGTVITFSYASGDVESKTVFQLAISPDNDVYCRTCWTNWRTWKKIRNDKDNSIRPIGTNLAISDLNAIELNSITNIAQAKNAEQLANAPFYPFQGIVTTISGDTSIDNIKIQFCITPYSNKFYYRYMWGNWKQWVEINPEIKFNYNDYKLFNAFDTVGCIGDSLASGECVSNEGGSLHYRDMYQYSWGQYMARATGNKFYNFSNGGLSTRTWLTSNHKTTSLDGNHDCKCYIIGLGQNDQISDARNVPVGNVSDIGTNADTYYGNYSKIINLLKNKVPKAKFFLLTNPVETSSVAPYNVAVRNIANRLENCYCIDLVNDWNYEFNSEGTIIKNNLRQGHYNAVAYSYMAELMMKSINKYMYEHQNEFNEIEFIGTDYSWN